VPVVIGLCEVENQSVIDDLVNYTYLSRHAYRAIYAGGKDERGIGLALIIDTSFFSINEVRVSHPLYEDGSFITTRPILSARLTNRYDSVTVIVTHWPSRRGGATSTEGLREIVAGAVKKEAGLARKIHGPGEKILIMGDLNCEPESMVVKDILGAVQVNGSIADTALYNLSGSDSSAKPGSYKYQGIWLTYDQVIVSGSLINSSTGYRLSNGGLSVFNDEMIMVPDSRYSGLKPYSTWTGPVYNGGYSDHLPVTVRFELASHQSKQE
jgi:endonuclease/exonuclease/phosphatase family metal-dependent hydrolase